MKLKLIKWLDSISALRIDLYIWTALINNQRRGKF